MVTTTETETALSELISTKMSEKGLSIESVASGLRTPITYEHMRGIVRGVRRPSDHVLRDIADLLGLPYDSMMTLKARDKISRDYGDIADILAGKKPGMEPIDRVWDRLTEDQQASLVDMAKSMAKRRQK